MEQHAIDQTEILVAESSVASESEGYPDIRQSILLLLRLILITLPVAIAFDIIEMAVGEQIAGSSLYFLTSNIIAYTVPFLLVIRFAFRKRREEIGGSLRKIAQKRISVQEQTFLVLLKKNLRVKVWFLPSMQDWTSRVEIWPNVLEQVTGLAEG